LASNHVLLDGLLQGLQQQPTEHQVVVCAPLVYLAQVQSLMADSPLAGGAQDVSAHDSCAYTGEASAAMLTELSCSCVLGGHSSRRQFFSYSNALTAAKVHQVVGHGMRPVLCVGETQEQHDVDQTQQVLAQQLAPVLALGAQQLAGLVIAYEPVWAIGSGRSESHQYAQQVHDFNQQLLQKTGCDTTSIVYRG